MSDNGNEFDLKNIRDTSLAREDLHFEKYWKLIRKKLHILIIFILLAAGAAFVKVSSKVPMYYSQGLLMIEPEKNVINFDRFAFTDYRNEYFNTQIRILKSRSLMKSVREEIYTITGSYPRGSLRVEPVEMTRLVSISYKSPDAEMAATMVNTLFKKFIEFNLDVKTQSSKQASVFITKQITNLQRNLAQKEEELQKYSKRKDIFILNTQENTVVEKFGDLNKAYTQAQIERINKESIYKELGGMKFADYPQVKQNQLISSLKTNYSTVESEYRRKSQIFKESYPEMTQLKSQMDSLQRRIQSETRDIAQKTLKEAESDYQSALKREKSLLNLLNQQKGIVLNSKTDAIYYNSLNIEVNNMRQLLDYLTKKQKESLLSSRLEGLQASNIKVIDPAEIPQQPLPSGKLKIILMASVLGLLAGGGLIFIVDYMDRTIKSPEEVKPLLGFPALGVIPSPASKNGSFSDPYIYGYGKNAYRYGKKKNVNTSPPIKNIELVNFLDPECAIAESYRSIRTSILLSTPKHPPQMMAVTSALPSEGKTATVSNLSISFAQLGKKVIIIDGDMRKPRINKIFRVKNTTGLSSFLVGKADVTEVIQKTHIPNLFVIPSGPIPPNPVELIDSEIMNQLLTTLKEKVDFIFIDTPPLIGIVDPIILGKQADGVILVTWGGKTHRNNVLKASDEASSYNIRVLGLVLNRVDFKREGYRYNYYTKYNYQYKYKESAMTPSRLHARRN